MHNVLKKAFTSVLAASLLLGLSSCGSGPQQVSGSPAGDDSQPSQSCLLYTSPSPRDA